MSVTMQINEEAIITKIASKLQLRPSRIKSAINLMKDGGSVPFIARYRKEQTGSLDETDLRVIKDDFEAARKTEERRIIILQSIKSQDKLTPALERKILNAKTLTEMEDLYLPYKPKRKTLATKALEKGLGPLAEIIRQELEEGDRDEILSRFFISKDKSKEEDSSDLDKKREKPLKKAETDVTKPKNAKEALSGAVDIIAEQISQQADYRKYIRGICSENTTISSHIAKKYAHLLKTDEQKEEEAKKKEEEAKKIEEAVKPKKTRKIKKNNLPPEKESSANARSHSRIKEIIKKQMAEEQKKKVERKKKLQQQLKDRQKRELSGIEGLEKHGELGKKDVDPFTFEMYFEFSQEIKEIPPHRILAMNRGEKEKVLNINLISPDDELVNWLKTQVIKKPESIFLQEYAKSVESAFRRYIIRAIHRELRSEITKNAEQHAINIFAKNLGSLLMQPPIKGRPIIGIDPGYRSGCKVAVIDKNGKYLDNSVIYPTPPKNAFNQAKRIITEFIMKYGAYLIAIGNGTASRETEMFVASLSKIEPKVEYAIVSEAGASVYSASAVAKEEFPSLDLTVRGAISIARRLQDPLSELIKIDPKSVGVGLYQHDVNQISLKKELDAVIEDSVNKVGVLVNSASYKLLEYVSGLNKRLARVIYDYAQEKPLKNREDLKKVSGLGEKAYEQCAGFLKILGGTNPLDGTNIHPESYWIVEKILQFIKEDLNILSDKKRKSELDTKLKAIRPKELIKFLGRDIGMPTLKDIVMGLLRPDRDPRDDLPAPILRKDIVKLEDLEQGMILKGTVRNVVDFGAFVDIGVKYDGLVHISEIKSKTGGYISTPLDVLSVGDIIDVRIVEIKLKTHRIQLSMKLDDNPEEKQGNMDISRIKMSGNITFRQKKKKI